MSKQKNDTAEIGHNKPIDVKALKQLMEDAGKIQKRQDDARMDMLALHNKAEDMGIDRKAFKAAFKQRSKKHSAEHMEKVNELLVSLGDLPLFHSALIKELADAA